MEYFLCFVIGWYVGRFSLKFMLFREAVLSMTPQERNKVMQGYDPEQMPIMHTETVIGDIYLYDTPTCMYMCNGKTIEEVAASLKDIHHILVAQVTHAGEQVTFVDGKIAEAT